MKAKECYLIANTRRGAQLQPMKFNAIREAEKAAREFIQTGLIWSYKIKVVNTNKSNLENMGNIIFWENCKFREIFLNGGRKLQKLEKRLQAENIKIYFSNTFVMFERDGEPSTRARNFFPTLICRDRRPGRYLDFINIWLTDYIYKV